MPSKSEIIEDFLAQIEEQFHQTLKGDSYPNYLGGRVDIAFTTAPRLAIEIHEIGKPGPKVGSTFKKNASLKAARKFKRQEQDSEEF